VFICWCGVTAALADEFRLAEAILGCCVTAALTPVGGVPGVYLDPSAPSVFRFGAQYQDELTQPASLIDRLSPDFARAPFGRNCPGLSGSGFGFARRSIFATLRSSTTSRS
jgi:hypothetical protein